MMPSVFRANGDRYDDTLTPERTTCRPGCSSYISAKRWMAAEWKHGWVTENTNAPPGTIIRERVANSGPISGMSMIAIVQTALLNRFDPSDRTASLLDASRTWYSTAASWGVRWRARPMNSAL